MDFIQHDTFPRHPFEYEGAMLKKDKQLEGLSVWMPVQFPEHRLQLDFYKKVILNEKKIDVPILQQISDAKQDTRMLMRTGTVTDSLEAKFDLDTFKIFSGLGYEIQLKEKKNQVLEEQEVKAQEQ